MSAIPAPPPATFQLGDITWDLHPREDGRFYAAERGTDPAAQSPRESRLALSLALAFLDERQAQRDLARLAATHADVTAQLARATAAVAAMSGALQEAAEVFTVHAIKLSHTRTAEATLQADAARVRAAQIHAILETIGPLDTSPSSTPQEPAVDATV